MTHEDYDEQTCITAGELRAAGMQVDATVPDCAWVPRAAMRFGGLKNTMLDPDGRTLHADVELRVDEPFRWVTATVRVRE